jgi:hypothetical protein
MPRRPSPRCTLWLVVGAGLLAAGWSFGAEKEGGAPYAWFDLIATHNPLGAVGYVGGTYRYVFEYSQEYDEPESYLEAGAFAGYCPAYVQGAAYVDWQPADYLTIHAEYDLYRFLAAWGSLLSFPSGKEPFGDRQVDQRAGEEKTGLGQRLFLQPTLYAEVKPIEFVEQIDVGYYLFDGRGPYFYEQESDLLLRNGDWALAERFSMLVEYWKSGPDRHLYLGPYYEYDWAAAANLRRNRFGGQFELIPSEGWGYWARPRFYGQGGVYLKDPNRLNQLYALFGFGGDVDF